MNQQLFLFTIVIFFHSIYSDKIQEWSWWPLLPSTPRIVGVHPNTVKYRDIPPTLPGFSFDPFNEINGINKESPIAYGSVINEFINLKLSNDGALSAFQFALKKLQLNPENCRLTFARMQPLYCTHSNSRQQMKARYQYKDENYNTVEFDYSVTFGINYYLQVIEKRKEMQNIKHDLVVGLDKTNDFYLFQHTFSVLDENGDILDHSTCEQSLNIKNPENVCLSKSNLRVLTYNIWNVNPPDNVYGQNKRWEQYNKRIDHFVHFIKQSNADIIGLQEVRFDNTFGPFNDHSQIRHIMKRLPDYQYVYRPAMTYVNTNNPEERIEEGPMILSLYPIVQSDYLLLSKDSNDPNDVHQRLCLHAVINIPNWGYVDIYTTHLSLSKRSREKTIMEIWKYMQKGKGITQILLGDLNAIPSSDGIQFLQGKKELNGIKTTLQDAFLELHTEPNPKTIKSTDLKEKFTFPTDKPSKRIDYLLYHGQGYVHDIQVIGQEPTQDTKHLNPNVGLLHHQSPIYASDHRGVVMELRKENST